MENEHRYKPPQLGSTSLHAKNILKVAAIVPVAGRTQHCNIVTIYRYKMCNDVTQNRYIFICSVLFLRFVFVYILDPHSMI